MDIDFKNYFQNQFFKIDKRHVGMGMPKNIFQEMAVPMDISKKPIKIEADDLEFLKQFPPKFWISALHQRYDDLADALQHRTNERTPHEKKIKQLLKKALLTGDIDELKGQVSEDLLRTAQQYSHVAGNEKMAEKAANYLAELESEKAVPHGPDPKQEGLPEGYKVYKFKNTSEQIVAKPYINRLIHRLETTRGHEHHPESGLHELGDSHGKYGYDLYDVKKGKEKIPHSTRGMQFPTFKALSERMIEYLNQNFHRMYGELDNDPSVVWKPIMSAKRGEVLTDTFGWKKIYNKLMSKWITALPKAEPGSYELNGTKLPPAKGFGNASELRKAAHGLAMNDVFRIIESGKLKSPPVPGIAPEGIPFQVEVGADGKKTVKAPPLYLPHKQMQYRAVTPKGTEVKTELIPMVKPAEYLRELGSEEGDEDIDPELLLGHEKDYVKVHHDDYRKGSGHLASGALHVTQNSSGRQHMDESDPEYQDKKEWLESEMGKTSLNSKNEPTKNGDGEYYYDIIKGIWNCINAACGGMTAFEVGVMKQNVHDLHQIVYQKMMMNLRDSKLEKVSGRRAFAANIASSWAQQDLGGGNGTRRLRKFGDKSNPDFDSSEKGFEGSDQKTNRNRPTGNQEFSYSVDGLRQIIASMENQARAIDAQRNKVELLSHTEISDQIAELLKSSLFDKGELLSKLQGHLKDLYMLAGYPENESDLLANNKVENYGNGNANSSEIVDKFKNDPDVKELLTGGAKPTMTLGQSDAIAKLRDVLSKIPADKLHDGKTQGMIMNYIQSMPEEFRELAKAEVDRLYGNVKPTEKIARNPQAIPSADGQNVVKDLISRQEWLPLASNDYFLHHANPQQLGNLIGKLQTQMKSAQPDDKDDYEFAISNLQLLNSKRMKMQGAV